ncbi:MAG: BrnA antitoxin family protein [Bryobacterales bacterium]|nr:BrnA antitoxin family protein [Bryobacterales bacterium]
MKEKPAGKASVSIHGTDWDRLRNLDDRQIRRKVKTDPEVRPTDANFWKTAKVVLPQPKQTVTIRLDADLLQWLRRQKGYQTRINAVLRTYMEAQRG